jgi:uncharacterized short protein YbdD (DUF466 family)
MSNRSDRSDLLALFDRSAGAVRVTYRLARTARLMIGIPDYETYVSHRRIVHTGQAVMTYEKFFQERRNARYVISKGRLPGLLADARKKRGAGTKLRALCPVLSARFRLR